MNGEALKIHIPSTTYPQFVHNRPLLSFLKRSKPPFRAHLRCQRRKKRKESEELGVVAAKNFGAGCGQVALHGRGEENWVCAKFPYSPITLVDGGERSCPNTAHFTNKRCASSLSTATFATC
jgi:hypothetical protein